MSAFLKRKYIIIITVLALALSCLDVLNLEAYGENIPESTVYGEDISYLTDGRSDMGAANAVLGEAVIGSRHFENAECIEREKDSSGTFLKTPYPAVYLIFILFLLMVRGLIINCHEHVSIRRWHVISYIHLKDGEKQNIAATC